MRHSCPRIPTDHRCHPEREPALSKSPRGARSSRRGPIVLAPNQGFQALPPQLLVVITSGRQSARDLRFACVLATLAILARTSTTTSCCHHERTPVREGSAVACVLATLAILARTSTTASCCHHERTSVREGSAVCLCPRHPLPLLLVKRGTRNLKLI